MTLVARWLRHLWTDETDARRALDKAALTRLEQRVQASERRHSGEIRLCVEASLPFSYLWRRLPPRARAITMFGKLRVWDTEHNNGVLIYLLLAERAIEIVADRGLTKHVADAHWQALVQEMRSAFRAGRYEEGLGQAIAAVDTLLVRYYPLAPGQANPNELPDRADLR